MDHMMPGMDGVTAMKELRSLDGEYYKKLPIIALTANAAAGVREQYLSAGFNDYLVKPVEIDELDSAVNRFIPAEKKVELSHEEKLGGGADGLEKPVIEGVDVDKGILQSGGVLADYYAVLEAFCDDVDGLLPKLKDSAGDPKTVSTGAHAVKGVAGTIGADEVSALAKELVEAGRSNDDGAINEKLPVFIEKLAALREEVGKAVSARQAR